MTITINRGPAPIKSITVEMTVEEFQVVRSLLGLCRSPSPASKLFNQMADLDHMVGRRHIVNSNHILSIQFE